MLLVLLVASGLFSRLITLQFSYVSVDMFECARIEENEVRPSAAAVVMAVDHNSLVLYVKEYGLRSRVRFKPVHTSGNGSSQQEFFVPSSLFSGC